MLKRLRDLSDDTLINIVASGLVLGGSLVVIPLAVLAFYFAVTNIVMFLVTMFIIGIALVTAAILIALLVRNSDDIK